jgi:hypothetical protein
VLVCVAAHASSHFVTDVSKNTLCMYVHVYAWTICICIYIHTFIHTYIYKYVLCIFVAE